jgi:hypothetical protein
MLTVETLPACFCNLLRLPITFSKLIKIILITYSTCSSNLQDFVQMPPVDFNDKLRLASSWFGMCGISAQLSPVPGGGGIQLLQADGFDLHSFHTLTGVTFMMVTEPNTTESSDILRTT